MSGEGSTLVFKVSEAVREVDEDGQVGSLPAITLQIR